MALRCPWALPSWYASSTIFNNSSGVLMVICEKGSKWASIWLYISFASSLPDSTPLAKPTLRPSWYAAASLLCDSTVGMKCLLACALIHVRSPAMSGNTLVIIDSLSTFVLTEPALLVQQHNIYRLV